MWLFVLFCIISVFYICGVIYFLIVNRVVNRCSVVVHNFFPSAKAEPTVETKPAVKEEWKAGLTSTEPTNTGMSDNTSTPHTDNKQFVMEK